MIKGATEEQILKSIKLAGSYKIRKNDIRYDRARLILDRLRKERIVERFNECSKFIYYRMADNNQTETEAVESTDVECKVLVKRFVMWDEHSLAVAVIGNEIESEEAVRIKTALRKGLQVVRCSK